MTEDEKFVREHWEWADVDDRTNTYGPLIPSWEVRFGLQYEAGHRWPAYGMTPEAAWEVAAELTRQRLEEIRQVEQEIGITRILSLSLIGGDRSLLEGVIARLEAALSDLRKGMKQ